MATDQCVSRNKLQTQNMGRTKSEKRKRVPNRFMQCHIWDVLATITKSTAIVATNTSYSLRKVFVEIANTPLTLLFTEFVLNEQNKINLSTKMIFIQTHNKHIVATRSPETVLFRLKFL